MGHFPAGGGALPKPGLGRYWWACWEVAWRFHKGLMGMQGLSWPSQTCSHICRLAFWWFSKLSFEGTFRLLKKKCRYILLWWILQSECFPDIQCGCFRFSMETVCPTLAWHVTWGKAIWFMVSAYKGWGKKKWNQALGSFCCTCAECPILEWGRERLLYGVSVCWWACAMQRST